MDTKKETLGTEAPASDFEDNLQQLREIVAKLQEGHLPLDRAMALYEEGVRLVGESRTKLEGFKTRVERLNKLTGELEPFEPGSEPGTDAK